MDVVTALQRQAIACEDLGSPMYAELLRLLVDDYEVGGVSVQALAGYEDRSFGEAIGLRLLGAVHGLVLAGTAPELAAFYPSVGGTWDAVLGWEAFEQVLRSRIGEVRSLLTQPPQTNEVGRAGALYGGLLHLVELTPLPVRLFEIGASGGLNLRADHFRYVAGGAQYGSADSPVVFDPAWTGAVPSVGLRIAERVGCDITPIDPLAPDGQVALTSYVWPDMTERLDRLRGAISVARRVPADVRREDAVSFVRGLELSEGHVTVVWHSIMWQYLSHSDRDAVEAALAALGARATPSAPLAHLRLEPHRQGPESWEYLVDLQTWPGGDRRVLGRAAPHGQALVWNTPVS
ncbi:DUF2332 domain-containing protein [Kribbella solani]|uniref:DUF2332 domain-containing protein n=1 Tax=Kribbella solani TaxID=236067 RepID=UPI0029BB5378|nr:DUF2332 domain-containing protein [Kribbella solani]MDX2967963.1 DUF2332 domain-containing protein [Kribbella solani]MDX3002255.1 DUF2332 domain-containing protein [Kribbella solani]